MRASVVSSFVAAVVAVSALSSNVARADEPMRSDDARDVDVHLDVGLGVQAFGESGDVSGGAAVEPYLRAHFSFVDADPGARRGFALHDDAWFELGSIGARDAGGFGETGAGVALLPGFRTDWFGLFFGPSVRAQTWIGGGKEVHAFTSTNLPFEARLELFDDASASYPRVILTGWFAPTPYHHQMFGGRLDVLLDGKDPMWMFLSIERIEGLQYDKDPTNWTSTHGAQWDVRAGISVGF
jgi:hypothetical protein